MKGMADGEIDAALLWAPSFGAAKQRFPNAKFHLVDGYAPLPEHRFNMRFAVCKEDKSLLEFLNQGIDEFLGLAHHKPRQLRAMAQHPNDALKADLCHGDLSIQFCANTPDANIHALRDIIKNLPGLLLLKWKQEGSVPPIPTVPGQRPETARNYLGFHDGSANPERL